MRLYLSSFRIGNRPDRLVALAGGDRRVAVIANAMDSAPADVRGEGVQRELTALDELGFAPEELDLRDYFGDHARLRADLEPYGVVWVRGGNVFMLRYALAHSGGDVLLRERLDEDGIVYAGYSAGPCVLAPSLRGLETVDPPDVVEAAYGEPALWDGLGVLDYAIVPHVESPDHPECEALEQVAARYRATAIPHRTLRDGEVLVIDGETTTLFT